MVNKGYGLKNEYDMVQAKGVLSDTVHTFPYDGPNLLTDSSMESWDTLIEEDWALDGYPFLRTTDYYITPYAVKLVASSNYDNNGSGMRQNIIGLQSGSSYTTKIVAKCPVVGMVTGSLSVSYSYSEDLGKTSYSYNFYGPYGGTWTLDTQQQDSNKVYKIDPLTSSYVEYTIPDVIIPAFPNVTINIFTYSDNVFVGNVNMYNGSNNPDYWFLPLNFPPQLPTQTDVVHTGDYALKFNGLNTDLSGSSMLLNETVGLTYLDQYVAKLWAKNTSTGSVFIVYLNHTLSNAWNFTGDNIGTWTSMGEEGPTVDQVHNITLDNTYTQYTIPYVEIPSDGNVVMLLGSLNDDVYADDITFTKDGTTNVLRNGNFESWTADSSNVLRNPHFANVYDLYTVDGWSNEFGGGNHDYPDYVNYPIRTTDAHTGTYALNFGGGGLSLLSLDMGSYSLTPTDHYIAKVWAKSAGSNPFGFAFLANDPIYDEEHFWNWNTSEWVGPINLTHNSSFENWTGIYTPAYLTGGTNGSADYTVWALIADGEFNITLDGVNNDIIGLDFSSVASMSDVATVIQTGIQTVFSSGACGWATDHFMMASTDTTSSSTITVTSSVSGGSGTDISTILLMDNNATDGIVTNKNLESNLPDYWTEINVEGGDVVFSQETTKVYTGSSALKIEQLGNFAGYIVQTFSAIGTEGDDINIKWWDCGTDGTEQMQFYVTNDIDTLAWEFNGPNSNSWTEFTGSPTPTQIRTEYLNNTTYQRDSFDVTLPASLGIKLFLGIDPTINKTIYIDDVRVQNGSVNQFGLDSFYGVTTTTSYAQKVVPYVAVPSAELSDFSMMLISQFNDVIIDDIELTKDGVTNILPNSSFENWTLTPKQPYTLNNYTSHRLWSNGGWGWNNNTSYEISTDAYDGNYAVKIHSQYDGDYIVYSYGFGQLISDLPLDGGVYRSSIYAKSTLEGVNGFYVILNDDYGSHTQIFNKTTNQWVTATSLSDNFSQFIPDYFNQLALTTSYALYESENIPVPESGKIYFMYTGPIDSTNDVYYDLAVVDKHIYPVNKALMKMEATEDIENLDNYNVTFEVSTLGGTEKQLFALTKDNHVINDDLHLDFSEIQTTVKNPTDTTDATNLGSTYAVLAVLKDIDMKVSSTDFVHLYTVPADKRLLLTPNLYSTYGGPTWDVSQVTGGGQYDYPTISIGANATGDDFCYAYSFNSQQLKLNDYNIVAQTYFSNQLIADPDFYFWSDGIPAIYYWTTYVISTGSVSQETVDLPYGYTSGLKFTCVNDNDMVMLETQTYTLPIGMGHKFQTFFQAKVISGTEGAAADIYYLNMPQSNYHEETPGNVKIWNFTTKVWDIFYGYSNMMPDNIRSFHLTPDYYGYEQDVGDKVIMDSVNNTICFGVYLKGFAGDQIFLTGVGTTTDLPTTQPIPKVYPEGSVLKFSVLKPAGQNYTNLKMNFVLMGILI